MRRARRNRRLTASQPNLPNSGSRRRGRIGSSSSSDNSAAGPEYEVEAILSSRYIEGGVEYLLKWKGYNSRANTWEPIENLQGCHRLVNEYHALLDRDLAGSPAQAPEELVELTEEDPKPVACGMTNGIGTSHSEGYGTEEPNTDPEVEPDDLPGGSDGDADVEDAEGRLRDTEILHRTSSKRRRRPKIVKQDTTESEDDCSRHRERPHRWSLRLSPQRETRSIAEESVSQIRPLLLGRVGMRLKGSLSEERACPGLVQQTRTLALSAYRQHGVTRLFVTSICFIPLGLLLLMCLLQRKEA
ncbi:polycomb group protein Pc [Heterodontus francisci]|uniref:polycomb group protein Pc n=1 Tax=Heterodontus francisci TaxID=7792 RepID=UPI00355BF80C